MTQLDLMAIPPPTYERAEEPHDAPASDSPAPRWTAPYPCVRGGSYYKFYWMQKIHHRGEVKTITRSLHIRGGNTTSATAQANRAAIDAAIQRGASIEEIKMLISSQARKKGNYRKGITPA